MDLVVDPAGGMQWTLEEQKVPPASTTFAFPPGSPLAHRHVAV